MVGPPGEPHCDDAPASTATEFLVALAHDVRGPVAALMHQVQLLTSDDLSSDLRDRSVAAADASAAEVARLLETLDDVERVVLGEIEVRRSVCDSNALLQEIDRPETVVVVPAAPVDLMVDTAVVRRIVRLVIHAVASDGDRPRIELEVAGGGVGIAIGPAPGGPFDPIADPRLDVHLRLATALSELHGGRLELGRRGGSRAALLHLPAVRHRAD